MESKCVKIDFPNKLLRYELKEYLEYNFKVYIKKDDAGIIVFGCPSDITLCQEHSEYFKSLDTQFLLHLNPFTKEALMISSLKLLFQSRCKVLISIENDVLYVFGQLFNATCIYNYLCYYTNIIEKESDLVFSETNETNLNIMCRTLSIRLPNYLLDKTKLFIYNILTNKEDIFVLFEDSKLVNANNLPVKVENLSIAEASEKKLSGDCAKVMPSDKNNDTLLLEPIPDSSPTYRTVIIDGCNVAYQHGNGTFSPLGIKFAVEYFVKRGNSKVYALLPRHRRALGNSVFSEMELADRLKYTPSRKINNVRETPYDDRFILDAALALDGVVVSNDQYRDLMPIDKYKTIIYERLIPYTFVENHIIIPNDPRGPNGPCLEELLMNVNPGSIQSNKLRQNQHNKPKSAPNQPRVTFNHATHQKNSNQFKPSELRDKQSDLYKRTLEIFPTEGEVIRKVMTTNPQVTDLLTVINLVMVALSNK